jgi:hypothetical protein
MGEFFKEDLDTTYACSSICPNETFTKTLFSLITSNPNILWSTEKIDASVRDI